MSIECIVAVAYVIVSFIILITTKGDADMTQIECLIACV